MNAWAALAETLLEKLNVRSGSLALAGLMVVGGIAMALMGLRDDGQVDLRTPFLTGQLKTGSLGVLVMFLGFSVTLCVIFREWWGDKNRRQRIEVHFGQDQTLVWDGIPMYEVKAMAELIQQASSKRPGHAEDAELADPPVGHQSAQRSDGRE